jgi:hypothetical protein
MSIEQLDARNKADVDAVSALYEAELGDSPVVLLGPRFLREFYYSKLVECGLLGCFVYRIEGQVVAFMSFTKYPVDFVGRGIRRYPLRLCWIMLKTVVGKPKSIRNIIECLKSFGGDRGDHYSEPGIIEALSLVVPTRHQRHVPPNGKSRLAVRFIETMAHYAKQEGAEQVLYVVRPENSASNLLFHSLGCHLRKGLYAGQTRHLFTHHVNEQPH